MVVQFWFTTAPCTLQLLLVLVVVLQVLGPGAQVPAQPPFTTHVEVAHACGCPGTPVAPQTTSELPVHVLVPGWHPQVPPPVAGSHTWPAPHPVHAAPPAPQLVVDSAAKGSHALWPVAAAQQPLQPVVVLHAQWPPLHCVPTPQTIPQPPQLLLSVDSLTQAAPQGAWPVAHWQASVVALQVSPVTAEQRGVSLTKVPAGPHVCTASSAGEHRIVFGAQVPTQPCPFSHV